MTRRPDTTHKGEAAVHALGGSAVRYRFPNGYGASVVSNPFSYGGTLGLWELAVVGPSGALCYSTPITSDVIGYLDDAAVQTLLDRIADLPDAD